MLLLEISTKLSLAIFCSFMASRSLTMTFHEKFLIHHLIFNYFKTSYRKKAQKENWISFRACKDRAIFTKVDFTPLSR